MNYHCLKSFQGSYLDAIVIDPQNKLSAGQHKHFSDIHNRLKAVFDPKLGTYNDKSGVIKATVDLGPTPPPPRKGRVPSYNSETLEILQDKFDELECLGVLARPEDIGVTVRHTSPSFLVKKPSGGHRN